jgi:ADP-heptose:LPS heptosyltransferase
VTHIGCIGAGCPICARLALPGYEAVAAHLSRPARPPADRRPCRHLGPATGQVLDCTLCGGKKALPVHACAIHGECSPEGVLVHRGRKVPSCGECRWLTRLGRPGGGYEPAEATVVCTADGIGDAVLGLAAVAGLKAAGKAAGEVVYRVKPHQAPWVRLFGGYDRLEATAAGGRDDPAALYPHLTYAAQNRERLRRPRWQHYAAACGTTAALPPVRPLPHEALAWGEAFRGHVVLCPRSQHGMRTWHASHWLRLEAHLRRRGLPTLAIDLLADPIAEFAGPKFVGLPPAKVAALMLASWCVVANDSGMAHVAGALGAPVVVLSGPIRGEALYGLYPHARCVDGPLACTGCHWHGPDYRRACDSVCASLQAVEPAEAADAAARARTSADFLDLALAAGAAPIVVETGCQRAPRDWGAGMSTTIFGRWLSRHGGRLESLDSSPASVAQARRAAQGLPVAVHQADSRAWLAAYAGPPLAGAYLDSADVGTPGCAECCLAEAQAVQPHLLPGAPLLIDDTPREGDGWSGKGSLAVPWLLARGWRVARQGHQTLLVRDRA